MALVLQNDVCRHCEQTITLRRYASLSWDNAASTVDIWVTGNGAYPGDQKICESHTLNDDIGSYGHHEPSGSAQEDRAWRDAYHIAWVGACNPRAVEHSLRQHAETLGTDHETVIAIAGHLAFLRGESLGPPDATLTRVVENAERMGLR